MEERTERESDSRRNGRLVGAAETNEERAEWHRLQRKYWACRKGKSGLSATERAKDKYAGAALAKRKRNRAVSPEYQILRRERVKVGESCTLARERRIRARAWRGKGGLYGEQRQIPRKKARASKKSLPRTSRRKHGRVSGRKSSLQDDLQSLGFTPSLAKPKIGKVGRRRARS